MNSPLTDERLREIMAQTEPQECYAGCTDPDCPYMHNGPIAPDIGEVHALITELLSLRQKDGEMVEALRALDDYWTEDFPGGPDGPRTVMNGLGEVSEDTMAVWRKVRSALSQRSAE